MKTHILRFAAILIITLAHQLINTSSFAQAPQKFNYQAVVRDNSGNILANQAVSFRISILQNSLYGASIYVETQKDTTTSHGVSVLKIGDGVPVYGSMAGINWANGPYFIKVELDQNGGTSYVTMGTTQLLSVPYALHSKTAETVTGGITETDPVFTAWDKSTGISITESQISDLGTYIETETDPIFTGSQAANITASDITNLGNLSGTNTGDQDGSETKVTAGTNVTVTGSGTTVSPYVISTTDTLAIGDSYVGGIIFWLDASGKHGLIAATADQSTGIQWYNGTNTVTNAVRNGIGAGMYNTERIIANQGAGSYAAQLCANYQGGGYGDWYLPSKYELNLLYLQKDAVGGFASAYYWSSTEGSNYYAWGQYFNSGGPSTNVKYDTGRVRAVRAF